MWHTREGKNAHILIGKLKGKRKFRRSNSRWVKVKQSHSRSRVAQKVPGS